MQEFLAIALSFPTLGFTFLLGVVLLYWLSVIVGAVDLDVLDGGADGAAEAASDAVAEAMGEAMGEAAGEAGDGDGDGEGSGGLLHALRLRHAPLTVIGSVVTLLSWVISFFACRYALPLWPGAGALGATLIGAASFALALPLTSIVTRPLAPLFETEFARRNDTLLGAVVVVKSGYVNASFGQAELHDGQAGLLLSVRCDEATLSRGDRALVIGWDEQANAFELSPLEPMLASEE